MIWMRICETVAAVAMAAAVVIVATMVVSFVALVVPVMVAMTLLGQCGATGGQQRQGNEQSTEQFHGGVPRYAHRSGKTILATRS